jgi:5-methyltetrahydrofolate--homocysteine methyltransferase
MINSISLEKSRFDKLIGLLSGTDLKIIALCMSDDGMPESADKRFKIAGDLINKMVKHNIAVENIYIDPLVQPIPTHTKYGVEFLTAVDRIMNSFDGCHTICGLTNISFGLPNRKLLNRTFLAMAVAKGLDAAIIDPLNQEMRSALFAAQALIGEDDFCMDYIKAYRKGTLAG